MELGGFYRSAGRMAEGSFIPENPISEIADGAETAGRRRGGDGGGGGGDARGEADGVGVGGAGTSARRWRSVGEILL